MVIKLRRAAEPRGSCFWALREARAASLPSACSCPFFRRASSARQEARPPPALAARELNHFLQLQLLNIPGRDPIGPGHRRSCAHLSHVQLCSESGPPAYVLREEKCSPGKVAPFTESRGAGLKEFQLPLTHTTASSSDLFIFFF